MIETHELKQALRQLVRDRKKQFNADELEKKSTSAALQLEQNPRFINAKTVMLYHSLHDEVNTKILIKKYLSEKNILLPATVNNDIIPIRLLPQTNMRKGAFNIFEPVSEPFMGDIDLIVAPGMAFDKQGHRLGRGRGYYDRFLEQIPHVYTIGICFDFQLLDEVPYNDKDIMVNEVIASKQELVMPAPLKVTSL